MRIKSIFEKIKNKESNIFDNFIIIVIIFSAILIGIETEPSIYKANASLFHFIDVLILSIFTIEIIIKIGVHGNKPWKYFMDPWNLFDFVIVIVSLLPFILTNGHEDTHAIAGLRIIRVFRVLRALRAFRILRLITHLKPLQLIVDTLIKSIPSLIYIIGLLGILFYLYAVIGHFLFSKYDPIHFGDLGSSLLTLFQSILEIGLDLWKR
jgi:voltage-gated sodium channel